MHDHRDDGSVPIFGPALRRRRLTPVVVRARECPAGLEGSCDRDAKDRCETSGRTCVSARTRWRSGPAAQCAAVPSQLLQHQWGRRVDQQVAAAAMHASCCSPKAGPGHKRSHVEVGLPSPQGWNRTFQGGLNGPQREPHAPFFRLSAPNALATLLSTRTPLSLHRTGTRSLPPLSDSARPRRATPSRRRALL